VRRGAAVEAAWAREAGAAAAMARRRGDSSAEDGEPWPLRRTEGPFASPRRREQRRRGLGGLGLAGRSGQGGPPPDGGRDAVAPTRDGAGASGGRAPRAPSRRRRAGGRVGSELRPRGHGAELVRLGGAERSGAGRTSGPARVSIQSPPYRATDTARELALHFGELLSAPRCSKKNAKGTL